MNNKNDNNDNNEFTIQEIAKIFGVPVANTDLETALETASELFKKHDEEMRRSTMNHMIHAQYLYEKMQKRQERQGCQGVEDNVL